jgi:hypothetical protein
MLKTLMAIGMISMTDQFQELQLIIYALLRLMCFSIEGEMIICQNPHHLMPQTKEIQQSLKLQIIDSQKNQTTAQHI